MHSRAMKMCDSKLLSNIFSVLLCFFSIHVLMCDSESSISEDNNNGTDVPSVFSESSTTTLPTRSAFVIGFLILIFHTVESLQNNQLCPDITTDNPSVWDPTYRTITVNLPKNRISQVYPNKNHDIPCNFNVKTSNNKIFNIGIRGIYLSNVPWNFDVADQCSSFIKFRITHPVSPEISAGREPEVICKIWKTLQHSSLVHPILWNFHSKIGISFQPTITNKKYLQIVFTASSRSTCSIRVQQYIIVEDRGHCNLTTTDELPPKFRFCGFYRCSDHVHIMSQLGSWTYLNWGMNNEYENNLSRDSYWSPLSDSNFIRKRTYWFTAVVRTSIVPILFFGMLFLGYKFFCVLYPSYPVLPERRARYSSAVISRFNDVPIDATNLRDNLVLPVRSRSHLPDPNPTLESDCPEARTNLLSINENNFQDSQPPPNYDDLYLPSYSEATKL